MLHPILDISNFNVVVTFSGKTFTDLACSERWSLTDSSRRDIPSCVRTHLCQAQTEMVPRRSMYVLSFSPPGSWTRSDLSVPSFVVGVLLGPYCTNLINPSRWSGSDEEGEIAYVRCDGDPLG